MKLTWYGHAAFLIETSGTRIILDPYRSPDSGGYEPIDDNADIVAVSHENDRYHSHLGQIHQPFELIKGLELPEGGITRHGVFFEAFHVFENAEKLPEDEVTVFQLTLEGLRIVFLGDLGHPLTEEEVAPLRGAEIVLAAAGGPPTIDFSEIPPLIEAINPRVIVPMHYKTPKINLSIQPAETFFAALPDWPVVKTNSSTIELTLANLPKTPTIFWMDHLR